jgi:hypothetical protein
MHKVIVKDSIVYTDPDILCAFLFLDDYWVVLHIIFVIPMIVNDVNLSVAFRGVTVA